MIFDFAILNSKFKILNQYQIIKCLNFEIYSFEFQLKFKIENLKLIL